MNLITHFHPLSFHSIQRFAYPFGDLESANSRTLMRNPSFQRKLNTSAMSISSTHQFIFSSLIESIFLNLILMPSHSDINYHQICRRLWAENMEKLGIMSKQSWRPKRVTRFSPSFPSPTFASRTWAKELIWWKSDMRRA